MEHYFNQSAYMRWLRSYHLTFTHYLDHVYYIREGLVKLSEKQTEDNARLIEDIEKKLDTIELKLEDAIPRDFQAEPLAGSELFVEDMKVFANILYNTLHKPIPFIGVYASERNRVHQVHQEFKFKEKLAEVKTQSDILRKSVRDTKVNEKLMMNQ